MAGLFCNSPELQRLEKQMRQPPGIGRGDMAA